MLDQVSAGSSPAPRFGSPSDIAPPLDTAAAAIDGGDSLATNGALHQKRSLAFIKVLET